MQRIFNRVGAAARAGAFKPEIVPVEIEGKKGEKTVVADDDYLRQLARLLERSDVVKIGARGIAGAVARGGPAGRPVVRTNPESP